MNWEEILQAVDKPSRYTGGEVNAVTKDRRSCKLSFLLAFPDTYEVGMSHLGLQILYGILNAHPDIIAERCFAPWPDMEKQLRSCGLALASLESHTPLNRFDIIGFSLQYELSFTNVLNMLELGGIPLRTSERNDTHPIIIAGGPCVFQPAPMSFFIDAFVIGEGEDVVSEIAHAVIANKQKGHTRTRMIEALAAIDGVYCPTVHASGDRIKKRTVADINIWQQPLRPIVPLMQTIHNRATIEIARGCTRGCRFCQAGMLWRPVRERSQANIEKMAEQMLCATGHDELSLLSLSTGDYSRIDTLLATLMERYHQRRVALALPSLRVETLKRSLMDEIKRVRKTSFTLAPEAGTQRLRDVINKGNTEDELTATVGQVFAAGWKSVKLYFMLGLPSETEADIQGIADLTRKAMQEAKKNRSMLTVSLSTFVPKPHTPFQWEQQIGMAETHAKQDYIKQRLRSRNLTVKWHDAGMSLLEGVISRGSEEIGLLIERAFKAGCRFDGWSDNFRFNLWQKAMTELGIDANAVLRQRDIHERLPWEHIDCGFNEDFLLQERQKSGIGVLTADCRFNKCSNCGVCDHRTIRPVRALNDFPAAIETHPATQDTAAHLHRTTKPQEVKLQKHNTGVRLRISFTKSGSARFLSHLELSAALIRAANLSGLEFVYSEGFHPLPKISFAFATAVGMESLAEYADIQVKTSILPDKHIPIINAFLPSGMEVKSMDALHWHRPSLSEEIRAYEYCLYLPEIVGADQDESIEAKLENFMSSPSFTIIREKKGNIIKKDIRPLVTQMRFDPSRRSIDLLVSGEPTGTVRPVDIITKVLGFNEEFVLKVRIVKQKTHFRQNEF